MAGKSIGAKITQSKSLNGLDEFLDTPFYVKLKEVEPQAYEEIKEKLTTIVKNRGSDEEISSVVREHTAAVSLKQLQRVAPETAKKFIDCRLRLLQKVYNVSPNYMSLSLKW